MFGEMETITTHGEDTLPDLARRYRLGYEEILRANPGVDIWLPGEGTTIVIPDQRLLPAGPREGIVVNLPEHRLYYYPGQEGRDAVRHHLPGEHRQDGLVDAAGQDGVVDKRKNPPGIRRSRCARNTRNAAIRCRPWSRPGPTIRWATMPCAWPSRPAPT